MKTKKQSSFKSHLLNIAQGEQLDWLGNTWASYFRLISPNSPVDIRGRNESDEKYRERLKFLFERTK